VATGACAFLRFDKAEEDIEVVTDKKGDDRIAEENRRRFQKYMIERRDCEELDSSNWCAAPLRGTP
jgi:hypothetical protein